MLAARLALALPTLLVAAPAAALCSGDTFEREWADAELVVRARLLDEQLIFRDGPLPASFREYWGEDLPVMLYRLELDGIYKGQARSTELLFQVWYSGRFVMDQGKDYLLFLNRYPARDGQPTAERGTVYVRNACGQSKPWAELPDDVLNRLGTLPVSSPGS